MAELLGEHELIAQDLFRRVRGLSDGSYDGPNVVLIRGESGIGKTAIIQRLYELLRVESVGGVEGGSAQYWPELMEEDEALNPLRGRAMLSPELDSFVWKADALPTFGWWSFNCAELRHNQKLDVVAAGKEQMATHLAPLTLAWWNVTGALGRAGKVLSDVIPRVRKDLQSGASDSALESALQALNIGLPLPSTLTSWAADVVRAFWQRRNDLRDLHRDVDMGDQHRRSKNDAGAELAEAIRSLTAKGLPGIVVIEDMHLMGSDLRSLLTTLSAPNSKRPIMIIGSAWPEGMTESDFKQWHADMTVGCEDQQTLLDVTVPPLEEQSLIDLLLRYAPETSTDIARKVVAKLSTPLFLLLWLTDPSVALEIRLSGNRILLTDEFKLPDSVEQVIESRWKSLPEGVKNALTAAVAGNPLDPTRDILNHFVPEVIAGVVQEIYQVPQESAYEDINAARDPIGWCKGTAEIANFADPLLVRHVRKSVQDLSALKSHAQRFAHQACTLWLDAKRDHLELPNTSQVDAVVDWYVQFSEGGQPLTTAAAHVHTARRNVEAYESARAIEHFQLALGALGEVATDQDRILILRHIADCHYAMSEFSDAEAILQKILPRQVELDGPSHLDTLATRLLQAKLALRSGDPLRALPILDHIWAQFKVKYSGQPVPSQVGETIYIPLAMLSGDVRFEIQANDEAIKFYAVGVDLGTQIYGENALKTLELKLKGLRAVHAKDPASGVAFDEGAKLLTKIRESRGEDSYDVLSAEANVIFWGYQAGRIADIEQAYRELDARIPDTREFASLRAEMYAWAGDTARDEQRLSDAMRWYSLCLPILNKHHGNFDPVSLRVSYQLGLTMCDLGRYDDAESVIVQLVENAHIAVGKTGLYSVQAEILLATINALQGRETEAQVRLTRTREELLNTRGASRDLLNRVENQLRVLSDFSGPALFQPIVETKNGRMGRLGGTGTDDDPLWAIEGGRAFPEIANQLANIRGNEKIFNRSPEHWTVFLDVLSRAYMNLGSCYLRTGSIEEADEAFASATNHAADFLVRAMEMGVLPSHPAYVDMAARKLAIQTNVLGMLKSYGAQDYLKETFDSTREQAILILRFVKTQSAAVSNNANVAFLEQVLSELIDQ